MKWWLAPALLLLLTGIVAAQNGNPSSGPGATAMTFGQTTLYTGHTASAPTNGQAVCNNGGTLGGCTGPIWQPPCATLVGATPLLLPANINYPVKECSSEVLGANTTLTSFASTGAPVIGWVAHIIITQPSGGHSYTFAFSGGSGVNIVYPNTGGCPSLPSMPTGTGHSLLLDMIYNPLPATPELDVLSCPTTGS